MKTKSNALGAVLTLALASAFAPVAMAQESLPFPPNPSGSTAARTMQKSSYHPLPVPKRLPANAPNVLIILIDDAGPAIPSTYGGPSTRRRCRIANTGISYNSFHTRRCARRRAPLCLPDEIITARPVRSQNLANDWDGYSGLLPPTLAPIAKVLGYYGYKTSAFGKWHNTPHTRHLPVARSSGGRRAG